jgi:hypothetical protein
MKRLLLILFLLAFGTRADATDYWVAVGGSVGAGACTLNDGPTDPGAYMSTIVDGISCLTNPGDRVIIKGGTYSEKIDANTLNIPSGSSFSNPITIKSYSNEIVTITSPDGNGLINMNTNSAVNNAMRYIIFDGTGASPNYGIVLNGADVTNGRSNVFLGGTTNGGAQFIRFTGVRSYNNGANNPNTKPGAGFLVAGTNNEFLNCSADSNGATTNWAGAGFTGDEAPYGFYINTTNHVVRNCKIFNNGGWGAQAYHNAQGADNFLFEQNTVYNNGHNFPQGSGGIWCGSGDACTVKNNIFYWTLGTPATPAPAVYLVGNGPLAYNNTITGYPSGGIVTEISTNAIVRNNIIYNNGFASGHYANFDTSGSGLTHGTNLTTNPLFADAGNLDFRPCVAVDDPDTDCTGESDAIDGGIDIASVTNDIVGTSRVSGEYDIGAWEMNPSPGNPAPDPINVVTMSFDEGTGQPQDESGNANHGTLGTGVTWTTIGCKYNGCLSFAGTGGVTIADSASIDTITHGYTLSAWVKPSSITSDAGVIVRNPSSKFFLFSSIDGYCGSDRPMGGHTQGGLSNACQSTSIANGVWTHMTVTYDGSTVRLYLGAVSVATFSASNVLDATTGTLQIGTSGFSEHFTGLIDEVFVDNYALSQAEIATRMNTPINEVTPSVAGSLAKTGAGAVRRTGATALIKSQGALPE